VEQIEAQLPSLRASVSQGIDLSIVLDRTTTIRASVKDVERTLVISIVLVIVVVFLFLRSARATLIPSIAVPVSLIATFAVMYFFGYSIDNLSLMALTISTGFVVDDAIVVMEDISRHLEAGVAPFAAALQGAREIGFTVFSISISLIAVFIPILMMGGVVGRLFREFAVVLSTAILISMIVSLTTTPMMCAYLLKDERNRRHGWLYRASEGVFNGMVSIYRHSLAWVLENHGVERTVDRPNPEGILPAAGHGRNCGRRARAAGRVVLPDGSIDPAAVRCCGCRSGGGQRDRLHRRRRSLEWRLHLYRVEAA
jgi:multidrug efflux pump